MKQLEPSLSDNVFLYIDLYALAGTLEMRESNLTHRPERNEPTSRAHFLLFRFQLCGWFFAMFFHKGSRRVRPAKFPRIRLIAKCLNLFKFLLPLLKLVARFKLQGRSFRRNRSRV